MSRQTTKSRLCGYFDIVPKLKGTCPAEELCSYLCGLATGGGCLSSLDNEQSAKQPASGVYLDNKGKGCDMADDLLDSSSDESRKNPDEVRETPEPSDGKRGKKKIVFVAIAVVIVAALAIGAGIAYVQDRERQRQEEAHDQAVRVLYDEHKAELDDIAVSVKADAEKAVLIAALVDVEAFKKTVEAD